MLEQLQDERTHPRALALRKECERMLDRVSSWPSGARNEAEARKLIERVEAIQRELRADLTRTIRSEDRVYEGELLTDTTYSVTADRTAGARRRQSPSTGAPPGGNDNVTKVQDLTSTLVMDPEPEPNPPTKKSKPTFGGTLVGHSAPSVDRRMGDIPASNFRSAEPGPGHYGAPPLSAPPPEPERPRPAAGRPPSDPPPDSDGLEGYPLREDPPPNPAVPMEALALLPPAGPPVVVPPSSVPVTIPPHDVTLSSPPQHEPDPEVRAEVNRSRERDGSIPPLSRSGLGPILTDRLDPQGPLDPRLVMVHDPDGPAAEAYRALFFRLGATSDTPCLMVTSSSKEEDGSVCAANLALTMAQGLDKKILLIETRFTEPKLAALFRYVPSECVGRRLASHRRDPYAPWTVTRFGDTNLHLLSVIPGQATAPALDAQALADVVNHFLHEEFRYVILDGPAAVEDSDARYVARCADGVVMAVFAGVSRQRNLRAAKEVLGTSPVVGYVLLHP
ncbi:MAG: hypothetical protein KC731_03590 [Myxococcales bacterium]|nr:hypothetical protein [Myxococcales bacterium]